MIETALELAIKLRDVLRNSPRTLNDSIVLGHVSAYIKAEQDYLAAEAKAKAS